jgi:uncharacterized low-complexity protein
MSLRPHQGVCEQQCPRLNGLCGPCRCDLHARIRDRCARVSMASAAHVAATKQYSFSVLLEKGLNGLCGPCRCDRYKSVGITFPQCLNGLCGPCRCDFGRKSFLTKSLNGLCGPCRCDLPRSGAILRPSSQWPLRPMSLRRTSALQKALQDGLNGLCGPCRCDRGGSFPIADKDLQPPVQQPPGARDDSGQNALKSPFWPPKSTMFSRLQE